MQRSDGLADSPAGRAHRGVERAGAGSVPRPAAIILAAGRGTRMPGQRPKVVYEVNGEPMVRWVVRAVRESGARPIVLVVGYGAEQVRAVFDGDDADLVYAVQDRQLGTGHATLAAAGALRGFAGEVIALAGDGPLIRGATIRSLLQRHRGAGAAATLAAAVVDDPAGYGRIVRDSQGHFRAIVEDRNATDAQRAIREIYPSYAVFDAGLLFEALRRLAPDEASGEYRITDVPAMLLAEGHRVELLDGFPPEEVLSINTPAQLREVDRILSSRVEACHERG